jgi:hypothetical protein
MDWILLVLILVKGPDFSQTHSHQFAGFTSEQLCQDAATHFRDGIGGAFEGMKIEVRAVCAQRESK